MEKLIINVAVCGSAPTREQNPAIPHSPKEIAQEALRAWRAGASVVHIHVRDPQTGAPDFKRELFAEALERIRDESDMLVNLTTSGFNIESDDPDEERLIPIALKPDLCSLDVGSLNFRGRVFINHTDWVDKAAQRMQETGVKPEIEVFELGHLAPVPGHGASAAWWTTRPTSNSALACPGARPPTFPPLWLSASTSPLIAPGRCWGWVLISYPSPPTPCSWAGTCGWDLRTIST